MVALSVNRDLQALPKGFGHPVVAPGDLRTITHSSGFFLDVSYLDVCGHKYCMDFATFITITSRYSCSHLDPSRHS